MNIYLMIGAPGSGKSYFCERNFKDIEIISCDQLREELFGDKRSYEIRETIKEKIKCIVSDRVTRKTDLVLDTTYFNEDIERIFLFQYKNINVHAIHLEASLTTCLANNNKRPVNRIISEEMITLLMGRLCPPTYSEGFKTIQHIKQQDPNLVKTQTPSA
jgi:predicted kinase